MYPLEGISSEGAQGKFTDVTSKAERFDRGANRVSEFDVTHLIHTYIHR